MRYLGIDYGTRTIGLAISDEGAEFAFPFEVLPNDAHLIENITHVIEEKKVGEVVIGDTRALSGKENKTTEACERFARALETRAKCKVHFEKEAWSSFEAARFAPDNTKRDDAAAAIILQRFLDARPKTE